MREYITTYDRPINNGFFGFFFVFRGNLLFIIDYGFERQNQHGKTWEWHKLINCHYFFLTETTRGIRVGDLDYHTWWEHNYNDMFYYHFAPSQTPSVNINHLHCWLSAFLYTYYNTFHIILLYRRYCHGCLQYRTIQRLMIWVNLEVIIISIGSWFYV